MIKILKKECFEKTGILFSNSLLDEIFLLLERDLIFYSAMDLMFEVQKIECYIKDKKIISKILHYLAGRYFQMHIIKDKYILISEKKLRYVSN